MLLFRLNSAIVGVVITPIILCHLTRTVRGGSETPILIREEFEDHLEYSHRYSECTIMFVYKDVFVIF